MDRTGPQALVLLLAAWATSALSHPVSGPHGPPLQDREGAMPASRLLEAEPSTRRAHGPAITVTHAPVTQPTLLVLPAHAHVTPAPSAPN